MDCGYEQACKAIANDPDREIKDSDFIDSEGHEKPALVKQAGNFSGSRWHCVQNPLQQCCGEKALQMVFKSWKKLYNQYYIHSKARAVGRLTKVLEPARMERGTFEDTTAEWEDEIITSVEANEFKVEWQRPYCTLNE